MTDLLPEAITSRMTDEEKHSLKNTLVICHGRKHKIIKDIDYSTTIFNDTDKSVGPDNSANISKDKVKAKHDKDMIIMMCCPYWIFSKVTEDKYGMPIEGTLKSRFFKNIKRLLSKDGKLYMQTFLYKPVEEEGHIVDGAYMDDNEKVIGLMEDFGFVFEYEDVLTIKGNSDYKMLVFSVKSK